MSQSLYVSLPPSLPLSLSIFQCMTTSHLSLVPTISVRITTAGLPIVGEHAYSLTCIANGAENIIPSVTYHWFKNYGTQTQLQVGFPANTLFFSNLSLSDAGRYTCLATISSPYLDDDITATGSHDFRVYCKLLLQYSDYKCDTSDVSSLQSHLHLIL